MKALFLPIALAVIAAAGCDVVNDPIPPGGGGGPGPVVDGVPRRVLLEDLTGHRCNNCPRAARTAEDLIGIYGDGIVLVGVHMVSGFAAPLPPIGDGMFDTDFRTPDGNIYEDAFNVNGLPKGMFNRTPYNGSVLVSDGAWPEAMAVSAGQEADLDIKFNSLAYDPVANTVQADVDVIVVNPMTGDHNLVIYLTEDHVIDWQIDAEAPPPYNVSDYEHRHVLRAALNGAWGEPIITGGAEAGDTLSTTFTYTLPGNVLQPDNCALVAYVSRTDDDEVMQVTERKFQP